MPEIETVAFDADDTLWHNEAFYRLTQDRFAELLADHADRAHLDARLLAAERRNLEQYGYGIKGFMLSMIETALDVTDRQVPGDTIAEIIAAGQEMLGHPIELLPHAREAVEAAGERHRVLLVTKGDLLDQERKLAQSGLGELFDGVEIVSEKNARVYAGIFARHGRGAARSMMVGNSVRSDVLAPAEAGAWAVHVPHGLEWAVESGDLPEGHERIRAIASLEDLAPLLEHLG